jgi:hypothetical protein
VARSSRSIPVTFAAHGCAWTASRVEPGDSYLACQLRMVGHRAVDFVASTLDRGRQCAEQHRQYVAARSTGCMSIVVQAEAVWFAATGLSNAEIGYSTQCDVDNVTRVTMEFCGFLGSLCDRSRIRSCIELEQECANTRLCWRSGPFGRARVRGMRQ